MDPKVMMFLIGVIALIAATIVVWTPARMAWKTAGITVSNGYLGVLFAVFGTGRFSYCVSIAFFCAAGGALALLVATLPKWKCGEKI